MSTMAQERMMADEADRVAMAVAEREAAADHARRTVAQAADAMRAGVVVKDKAKPDTGTCDNCNAPLMKEDGTPSARAWRVIGTRLAEPMPSKKFRGRGGQEFDYIDARQVARRLDEVVGPGNWSTQVQVVRAEHPVAVMVGLAIFGVWKWDAGYGNNPEAAGEFVEVRTRDGKPVVDPTTGEVKMRRVEDEPLKAAVSDGFKRAAVQWAIGRWLYGD